MTALTSPDVKLLEEAELRAERSVSVLRIIVALGLFLVLALSIGLPPEELEGFLKRQILIALSFLLVYFLLGCLTLWMARSGRFRRWMVWPVVTFDCLFALANTWTGLENVNMPGALTFLLPPTWLVPVVLAFAVLRFNPYLQAYSVVLVTAGLAVLIFLVPNEPTPDLELRLRHLVEVPPNIARLAMISLSGLVLVVAAAALRQLLHRSLIETQTRLVLTRYLPARLAERLQGVGLENLRSGQRQKMGVLFIDIRGFTSWCETKDPSEVGAFVTAFRDRVEQAARRSGGLIDKFIGDAAMLLFEGDTAARQALDCALDLSNEVAEWSNEMELLSGLPVRVGIGLHWGEVFSGVVGTEDRLEYTAFGDTVNVAARLEQLTKELDVEIIVSEAAAFQAALAIEEDTQAPPGWRRLPPIVLRGRSDEIVIFGLECPMN